MNRRWFLRNAALGLALGVVRASGAPWVGGAPEARTTPDPWTALPVITPPNIPRKDFLVKKGNIAKAIDAAYKSGGGRVIIPAGDYETAPIHLKSRIELHVSKGATLRFTRDTSKYPLVLTRWEGVELMNYTPLIYALDCEDIAVTGEGTLDGQADAEHWWPWKGVNTAVRADVTKNNTDPAPQLADRNALFKMGQDGVPVAERVFGQGHFLRPSFIEPYRCRNVLIEGLTILNAPFWVTHPTLCTNVTVRGITVNSHGPNNDGCDPESCRDVLIEDCVFDTGDDCIALKSGRNNDGRRLRTPVENVIIRNCQMKDGHGGITIGSEISGGARNIFAEKCRLDSPNLERGLRLKTNTVRGGIIENVYVRDIEIGTVKLAPIEIDLRYEPPESGPFIPEVRNITVERLRSQKSKHALYIRGLEQAPVRNIAIRDSAFRGVAQGHVIEGAVDLTLERVITEGEKK
ncbi:MAG TPA: glycoside hydrolase family 28 protein [Thermoanaerobaculia bacterium]|nr:glycoside hydrolase family 28 protein [Thermoanaerobaculia bacterium]